MDVIIVITIFFHKHKNVASKSNYLIQIFFSKMMIYIKTIN